MENPTIESTQAKDALLPKLFIGPWVGEFGIEILYWQGIARAAALSREWSEVVVGCRLERRFIYEDFATNFVDARPPSEHVAGPGCLGYDTKSFPWADLCDPEQGDAWLNPFGEHGNHFRRIQGLAASLSVYRDFRDGLTAPERRFDLLIHARATTKHGQNHKNWPISAWNTLINTLPSDWQIASIGDRRGAHKIEGTADLRGISLRDLAAQCSGSKMIIGPSSGPIHFAMHCGLPALIWMGEHQHHYYPQWNPLAAPVVCLSTWQPNVETVLKKIRNLELVVRGSQYPLRYLVCATKRSGHHAVTDWIATKDREHHHIWLNDCISERLLTPPQRSSGVPSAELLPKHLSTPKVRDAVVEIGVKGAPGSRIVSVEGAPLDRIARLPEAREAERIVFVLRDAANLCASLLRGLRNDFEGRGYLGDPMREKLNVYREYLFEATGRSNILGTLRERTIFISYNRWHADDRYRREILSRLGIDPRYDDRGIVAQYGPGSGFDAPGTPASALDTLGRWKSAIKSPGFWTACRDPELFRAELDFHGETIPLSTIDSVFQNPSESDEGRESDASQASL